MTSTAETRSVAAPAATTDQLRTEQRQPGSEQQPRTALQQRHLTAPPVRPPCPEPSQRYELQAPGQSRHVLVAALGAEVGATTVAAVLASVLAERVGRVAALCVNPDAGGLTARLPAPPSPATDRTTPQLEVRTVAEQDVARTAGSTDEDVTVLDPGGDLGAAARHGLLDWADQLVVVLSAAGESTGKVVPADWLVVQGHAALARDTVTVVVGLTASAPTAPVLSYDGRGQPVVHLPFDAHLKEGEVVDLTRLSVWAAAAAQQLAALVGVPSAVGPPALSPPSAAPVGLPGGLSVPSLVVDSGASDTPHPPTPVTTGPAFGSDGSGPPPRPLRTVVICTVLAVLTVVGLSRLGFGSDGAPLPAACAAADGLPAHAGHPTGAASCVGTQFGEQAAQENNPTLLIVEAPSTVRPGEDIEMQVSVRNLVRDAFPVAAHGGYYSEPAELTRRASPVDMCTLLAATWPAMRRRLHPTGHRACGHRGREWRGSAGHCGGSPVRP